MKLKPETRNLSKIPQKAGKPKNSVDLRQSQLSLTPAQREGPGFPFWNKKLGTVLNNLLFLFALGCFICYRVSHIKIV